MQKSRASKRITTLIVVFPLLVLLIYGLLSHIFFFYYQNNEVKKELVMYEKTLMDAQRDTLREKVENLVQFIRYYDGRSSQKIKDYVKNIVNVTADIANNLYAEHHNKMSEYKLKEIISWIKDNKSMTKKEIINKLGWGRGIKWTPYRLALMNHPNI